MHLNSITSSSALQQHALLPLQQHQVALQDRT
jgi:hypothetical protein